MNFDFKTVFPDAPAVFEGSSVVRFALALLLIVMVVRSCIHLFASDGGAHRIGGIDISVEGGKNIIALFHQWGAIQLLLAGLLVLMYFRYPGFTPLIVLTVALDPALRFVASRKMSVTTVGTPPGKKYNGIAFVVLMFLFVASISG
ncbi:MAG: hypothetical protein ACK5FW_09805 [Acidimicrobiaceae bacterium]|jgi:hypothetical protein